MDNLKDIKKTEKQIKELLKEFTSDEFYNKWGEAFSVENVDEKEVLITYHRDEDYKGFKKECGESLKTSIKSVLGDGLKIRIQKKKGSNMTPKLQKNLRVFKFFLIGMVFVCLATAIIIVLFNYIGNRNFRETFYGVSSIKVDRRLRVIQISDLHGSSYGKDNKKLLERIEKLEPDIIICTGDIVDSVEEDTEFAVNLGKSLSKIAPSYYIYGNNEVEGIYDVLLNQKDLDKKFGFNDKNRDETALLKLEDNFEKKLEATGIKVLKNEKDTICVDNMNIDIYGVLTSNPSSFWSYSEKSFAEYIYEDPDNIKITAVHEPFILEEFSPDFWGDLVVIGHTHGGVVRVPVIGPLYTHEGGLFPEKDGKLVYGRYSVLEKPVIVSSGLENKNIFRINNQPELVVIDINKF